MRHACAHYAGELAFDGAAVGVRLAALEGLELLAQNPLAQPLVKALLPGLRPALWDASLAVRAAFARFLLTIGCAACSEHALLMSRLTDTQVSLLSTPSAIRLMAQTQTFYCMHSMQKCAPPTAVLRTARRATDSLWPSSCLLSKGGSTAHVPASPNAPTRWFSDRPN